MRRNADAASRVLPDLSGSALKVVRVAVDEVRARVLTDSFDRLTALLGGVELELISSHQPVNHQSRSIELQIRNCLPETDTLIARKIGDVAYAVYGSGRYVAENPAANTEDRYRECAWLGFAPDNLWYPTQLRWLEARRGTAAEIPLQHHDHADEHGGSPAPVWRCCRCSWGTRTAHWSD
jgi:hypothetical protein